MDDEITNTDTAIDHLADKSKKYMEEDLPSFGSLMNSSNLADTVRRKSEYIPKSKPLGEYKSTIKNVFGGNDGHQGKLKKDPEVEKQNNKFGAHMGEAPEFGAFGKFSIVYLCESPF